MEEDQGRYGPEFADRLPRYPRPIPAPVGVTD